MKHNYLAIWHHQPPNQLKVPTSVCVHPQKMFDTILGYKRLLNYKKLIHGKNSLIMTCSKKCSEGSRLTHCLVLNGWKSKLNVYFKVDTSIDEN